LCAYVAGPEAPDIRELTARLKKRLPGYMVPTHFVVLDKLPLTASGKLNRKALPKPEGQSPSPGAEETAEAVNLAELEIRDVWRKVLGRDDIGVHDSFFESGGHSLLAIHAVGELQSLGYDAQVRHLFEHPTPAELAWVIGNRTQRQRPDFAADASSLEALIRNRLKVECRIVSVPREAGEWLILMVRDLTPELTDRIGLLLHELADGTEPPDGSALPHYIVEWQDGLIGGDEEALRRAMALEPDISEERMERMLRNIDGMQEAYAEAVMSRPVETDYPLSPSQRYHLEHPDVSGTIVTWNAPMLRPLMSRAFAHLIEAEDVLRSTLTRRDGEYRWTVHASGDRLPVPWLDLSGYAPDVQEKILRRVVQHVFLCPYDLENALPYRVLVARKNLREHLLILPFAHVVFDYISSGILKDRIADIYARLKESRVPAKRAKVRFRDFVEQITKGPTAGDEAIMREFELASFEAAAAEIRTAAAREERDRYTVVNFEARIGPEDAADPQTMWERALGLLTGYFRERFGTEMIPFWLTRYGRRYAGRTWFDTIGEFVDYVPVLADARRCAREIRAEMERRLALPDEWNLHFSYLMFNPDAAAKFPLSSGVLSRCFGLLPVNLNYLGEWPEEADSLGQALGDVNAANRNRVLCTVWHRKNRLHVSVVLPYRADAEAERERMRKWFERTEAGSGMRVDGHGKAI
jgi:fengycin family lipopeptide synthetase D